MTYACPNDCGSTTFVQIVRQQETVTVTEDGEPLSTEVDTVPDVQHLQCAECGKAIVEETIRTFIVHPDGTGEIYNLQRVDALLLPEFFQQFTVPEDDSWQDVADRWLFYDATHLSEEEITKILDTHNEDCERLLEHGDFIGFTPFIRNSLSGGEK